MNIHVACELYPVVDRVDRSSQSNLGQVESIEKIVDSIDFQVESIELHCKSS